MYSDEWMRQNQFLGKSARVGDILESKRRKLPELLSVEMTSTVRDAITTMNRFGVSQLPVFDKEISSGPCARVRSSKDLWILRR